MRLGETQSWNWKQVNITYTQSELWANCILYPHMSDSVCHGCWGQSLTFLCTQLFDWQETAILTLHYCDERSTRELSGLAHLVRGTSCQHILRSSTWLHRLKDILNSNCFLPSIVAFDRQHISRTVDIVKVLSADVVNVIYTQRARWRTLACQDIWLTVWGKCSSSRSLKVITCDQLSGLQLADVTV